MAKNKKQNATLLKEYKRERNRIQSFIRRNTKSGCVFDFQLPDVPKKITEGSVRKLKNITKETLIENAQYGGEASFGEIVPATKGKRLEAKERARKAKETREAYKKAEQEFWSSSTGKQKDKVPVSRINLPNGGDIIMDNTLDDFIRKLSSDTPSYTYFGNKRTVANYDASEREKTTLYSLTMNVIARDGKDKVGWRIQESGDRVWDLVQYVLYGSDATQIASASRELADIINGGELTLSDYADLGYEQEMNEDYEYPE